ncbi:hypothetical protein [Salinicola endophyticus]|uniref:Uncharacterized protein n=1 Tax=Salinicola endophyticus TaxID=1949083 RepID=A0AB74U317_9GAMM
MDNRHDVSAALKQLSAEIDSLMHAIEQESTSDKRQLQERYASLKQRVSQAAKVGTVSGLPGNQTESEAVIYQPTLKSMDNHLSARTNGNLEEIHRSLYDARDDIENELAN